MAEIVTKALYFVSEEKLYFQLSPHIGNIQPSYIVQPNNYRVYIFETTFA